jgi:GAF domain-containing protein
MAAEAMPLNAQLLDEKDLRNEELETLYAISTAMAAPGDLQSKVSGALEAIAAASEAPLVLLRLFDPEKNELRLTASAGSAVPFFHIPAGLPIGDDRGSQAFVTCKPAVTNDYQTAPSADERWKSQGVRSTITLPLSVEKRKIGVITALSREKGYFTDRKVRLLTVAAESISSLLEKARLEEEERLQAEELGLLFEISRLMDEPGSLERKVKKVLDEVVRASQARIALLRVMDETRSGLRTIATSGSEGASAAATHLTDTGLATTTFQTDGPVIANQYADSPHARREAVEMGVRSAIGLPVYTGGSAIGALILDSLEEGHFTERRVRLLTTVTQNLGALLENALLQEAEQLRTEEMTTLLTVSNTISAPGSFEEKVTRALDELVKVSNAAVITLRLPNEREKGLRVVAQVGPVDEALRRGVIPFTSGRGTGISFEAFESGRTVVVNDLTTDARTWQPMVEGGIRSALSLPVRSEGRPIGLLNFASFEVGNFTEQRVRILEGVASQFGPLIENARLQEDDQVHRAELEALVAVSHLLVQEGTFQEKVQRAVDALASMSDMFEIAVRVPDLEDQVLRLVATTSRRRTGRPPETIAFHQGVAGRAYQQRRIIVSNEYASDPLAVPELVREGLGAGAGLPMIVRDKVVGVLLLGALEPGFFTERRIKFFAGIADGIASLLENARLQEEERIRREEAEVLLTLARLLAGDGPFVQRANRAMEEIAAVANVPLVMLRLPDETRTQLMLTAYAAPGISMTLAPAMELGGDTFSARAFVRGETIVSNDYRAEPNAVPSVVEQGVQSAVYIPIKAADETTGILVVASKDLNHFTERRVRLLTIVANGMSAIMEAARLREDEHRRAQEMETLFTAARLLVEEGTFEAKATRALEEIAKATDADGAVLWLAEEERQALRLGAAVGVGTRMGLDESMPLSARNVMTQAFWDKKTVTVSDYLAELETSPLFVEYGLRAGVVAPILVGSRVLGIVRVDSTHADHFTEHRAQLLSAIADGIGAILQTTLLYEEMNKRNRQLEQRVREVTVLNELFQRHLVQRFSVHQVYEDLVSGLRRIAEDARELAERARLEPLPDIADVLDPHREDDTRSPLPHDPPKRRG